MKLVLSVVGQYVGFVLVAWFGLWLISCHEPPPTWGTPDTTDLEIEIPNNSGGTER